MDINQIFAIRFLGTFGLLLVWRLIVSIWYHALRCFRILIFWTSAKLRMVREKSYGLLLRHILLRRVLRGRYFLNPTRVELLYHVAHWTATIFYSTFRVGTLDQAANRAAQLATIHMVPLLVAYQLSFISRRYRVFYTPPFINGKVTRLVDLISQA